MITTATTLSHRSRRAADIHGVAFWARVLAAGLAIAAVRISLRAALGASGSVTASDMFPSMVTTALVPGLLIAVLFAPSAATIQQTPGRHFLIWGAAVGMIGASTLIEGAIFQPATASRLVPSLTSTLIESAIVASLITWLFAWRLDVPAPISAAPRRSPVSWTWRFLLAATTYLATYLVFGAVNYALVTRPYYEAHAGGLEVPAGSTILLAEVIRAPLIVCALLPLIVWSGWSRTRLLIVAGGVLFVVGGVGPLFVASSLPLFLLIASGWEIMLQNVTTGVAAALLLAPSWSRGSELARKPVGAHPRLARFGRRAGRISRLIGLAVVMLAAGAAVLLLVAPIATETAYWARIISWRDAGYQAIRKLNEKQATSLSLCAVAHSFLIPEPVTNGVFRFVVGEGNILFYKICLICRCAILH